MNLVWQVLNRSCSQVPDQTKMKPVEGCTSKLGLGLPTNNLRTVVSSPIKDNQASREQKPAKHHKEEIEPHRLQLLDPSLKVIMLICLWK